MDLLFDYLRGAEPASSRVEIELKSRAFATTVANAFELSRACAHPARRVRRSAPPRRDDPVAPGEESAATAAHVRRTLAARGDDIGMADCLIAGICLTARATLLTNNRRHVERVDGLRVSGAWR